MYKLLLSIILSCMVFGCKEQETFDPELANMYWVGLRQSQEQVRICLKNEEYVLADSFAKLIDKSDSEVVNYYRKCGRDASYHGTEFINAGNGIWYEIATSGPSKADYSKTIKP